VVVICVKDDLPIAETLTFITFVEIQRLGY